MQIKITSKTNQRSGITLLFVVSMIVLFLLMGTTFVVVSHDYLTDARRRGRMDLKPLRTNISMQNVLYDFLRGPSLFDVNSPLRGHSLLADQYGYGYEAFVDTAVFAANTGNQIYEIQLKNRPYDPDAAIPKSQRDFVNLLVFDPTQHNEPPTVSLTTLVGGGANNRSAFFNGQVLSFVSGPAAGISTRIIDHVYDGANHVFRVIPEWFDSDATIGDLVNARVVINGRAFGGYGAGLDLTATAPIRKEALLPNFRVIDSNGQGDGDVTADDDEFFNQYVMVDTAGPNLSGLVSVNEDYDAIDHNNVFLSASNAGAFATNTNASESHSDEIDDPIASFYRPELWRAASAIGAGAIENQYSFRPVFVDRVDNATGDLGGDGLHDEFDIDGNPVTAIATANRAFPGYYDHDPSAVVPTPDIFDMFRPLDVDNIGNGIADSAWIDVGLAKRTLANGKVVKPLVAPLIIDLDNRLNVNAHGSLANANSANNSYMTPENLLGNLPATIQGVGMGPAEVSLKHLASTGGAPPVNWDYEPLLIGDLADNIHGRYGDPDPMVDGRPGIQGRDPWSVVRFVGYPDETNGTDASGFNGGLFTSTPLDMQGRYGYGFPNQRDMSFGGAGIPVGMPGTNVTNSTWIAGADINDSPYEVSLLSSQYNSNDNLFDARELERVLRVNDSDSIQLPARLQFLLGQVSSNDVSQLVTTHSFEVPRTPLLLVPGENVARTVPQRLQEIIEIVDPGLDADTMRLRVESLLAPEVLRGLPMDVNRMFGDGQDNDNDGVFDEHGIDDPANPNSEINEAREELFVDFQNSGVIPDYDNDGDTDGTPTGDGINDDPDDSLSRQIFARHLFVLFWVVAGGGDQNSPPDMNNDGMQDNLDVAALAQWCVNVVDFRDADAINTAFEYDLNPFDGWSVPGDLSGPTVWGAERPELLITETLAMHDRKTEDLINGGGTTDQNDQTFDSNSLPVASCFVELYSPHLTNANSQKQHAELYSSGGVNLAAIANYNDGNGNGVPDNDDVVPVWRMVFTRERGDSPFSASSRRVYFTKPSATVGFGQPVEDGTDENFFFPDSSLSNIASDSSVPSELVILPDRYAMIGSSGVEYNNGGDRVYRTTIGRKSGVFVDHAGDHAGTDLNIDETRQIRLIPDLTNMSNGRVEIEDGDGDPSTMAVRNGVLTIPINRSGHVTQMFPMDSGDAVRSFGLSDPNNGYFVRFPGSDIREMSPGTGGVAGGDGYYFHNGEVRGEPVDVTTNHDPLLFDDATHGDYRYVALQRLANPQAPYDSVFNPYITVDEEPVDLVVFNGADSYTQDFEPGLQAFAIDDVKTEFTSVERGETDDQPLSGGGTAARQRRMLWKPEWSSEPPATDQPGATILDHNFNFEMNESWGQMNDVYRENAGDVAFYENTAWPSLAWNNRPFVSQYELAMVPGGSGRFLVNEFTDPGNQRTDQTTPISTLEVLQNFSMPGANFDAATSSNHLLKCLDFGNNNLSAIFEFIEVPSKFVGTEFFLNPSIVDGVIDDSRSRFNPPYNKISRYRNPGTINVNTILNQEVWNGFMGDYATVSAAGAMPIDANALSVSRQGAGTLNLFTKPFRSPGMGRFVPLDDLGTPLSDTAGNLLEQYESQETAYARQEFRYDSDIMFEDTQRNQEFADRPLNRFANIGANTSSVFAIWLTVSWFEVDENGLLGAEVVDDVTLRPDRKKAFFIYDRSIPVAFEPGQNHNVERGILVQTLLD